MFLVGLTAHSLIAVLARAFYALKDTRRRWSRRSARSSRTSSSPTCWSGRSGSTAWRAAIAISAWLEADGARRAAARQRVPGYGAGVRYVLGVMARTLRRGGAGRAPWRTASRQALLGAWGEDPGFLLLLGAGDARRRGGRGRDPRRVARVADRGAPDYRRGRGGPHSTARTRMTAHPAAAASPAHADPDPAAWDAVVEANPLGSYLQLTAWARVKAVNGWTSRRLHDPDGRRRRPGPAAPPGTAALGVRLRATRPGAGPLGRGVHRRASPSSPAPASARAPARATCASTRRSSAGAGPDEGGRRHRRAACRGLAAGARDPAGQHADHRPGPGRGGPVGRPAQEVAPVRQQGADRRRAGGRRGPGAPRRVLPDLPRDGGPGRLPDPRPVRVPRRLGRLRPDGRARLLFAELPDGEPVATLFLVRSGTRVVEPYGGMTQAGAESRANYLLKWEAIRSSREAGATSYDLWGLAHAGIDHFKTGLRRARDPLRRGLGPRPRRVRADDLRGRAAGARPRGAPAPRPPRAGRRDGRRLRGRRRGRRVTRDRGSASWRARSSPAGTPPPVDAPGGHVLQSRAWAEHRAARGLAAALPRGRGRAARLVLTARGRSLPGGSAYVPRGPVGAGTSRGSRGARRAGRGPDHRRGAGRHRRTPRRRRRRRPGRRPGGRRRRRRLRDRAVRPRASTRSPRSSRPATGWRSPLAAARTRRPVFDGIAKATRQRIRRAERDGVVVLRWDAAAGDLRGVRPRDRGGRRRARPLLRAAARDRRPARASGSPGPAEFTAWWRRALAAGHLVYLEAREGAPDGDVLGGLVLYRHGTRLSTAHSADRAERRRDHPGTMHLLRWRAIQLALAEGCNRDGPRGRGRCRARGACPVEGEPTFGLYEHKRSFGAQWVAAGRRAGARHPRLAVRRRAGDDQAGRGRGAREGRRVSAGPGRRSSGSSTPRRRRSRGPLAGLVARLAADGLVVEARGRGTRRGRRRRSRPSRSPGVAEDSRQVRAGTLFVAVPGFHVDGHDFVARAAAAGAAAVIVERPLPDVSVPQLVVTPARPALAAPPPGGSATRRARLGDRRDHRHRRQDDDLVPRRRGPRGRRASATGLIGTVETKVGDVRERHEAHVTTPGAPELQATLRAMARQRQRRRGPRDHVARPGAGAGPGHRLRRGDLHEPHPRAPRPPRHLRALPGGQAPPVRGPRRAARRTRPRPSRGRAWPKIAVVNRDDDASPAFEAAAREAGATVLTYGTRGDADVRATGVEEDAHSLRIRYAAPSGDGTLALRLAGRFNVHNALAVVALGDGLGLDPAAVRAGLEGVRGVPGRMERIDAGQPFGVIVDYAHSPASLQGVLELLAPIAAARGGGLIAVFGSGGERDTAKRAVMGRIAGERCRLVVADGRGSARRGPPRDRRGDRPRRGVRGPAPRGRRPGHRRPPRGRRRRVRARPSRRRRAARRQGPRAHDPVRGPRDPLGRGDGGARDARGHGLGGRDVGHARLPVHPAARRPSWPGSSSSSACRWSPPGW